MKGGWEKIPEHKEEYLTLSSATDTVGGQMSGTAGRMFFCQKGKPLTIS